MQTIPQEKWNKKLLKRTRSDPGLPPDTTPAHPVVSTCCRTF